MNTHTHTYIYMYIYTYIYIDETIEQISMHSSNQFKWTALY